MAKKIDLDTDHCKFVIETYNHPLVHLRQQIANGHFGLVFGAGIGTDLGFPKWSTLLERVAAHKDVQGTAILDKVSPSTSAAQHLFQHFKSRRRASAKGSDLKGNMLEMRIRAGWRNVIRECLYADLPNDLDEILKKDRYLESLVPLMQRAALTVTYNFDDTLQKLLKKYSKDEELGSSTYWSGNVQLLPMRKGGVIYHPNGYLPRGSGEKPSDHLVLLEDSFVDQVIDSMAGQYASLASHICKNTCLFVGLSLEDPGLKHLLRQNAKAFPGQYHYYIRYVRDAATADKGVQRIEADANFEVYNLITLHLTAEQIRGLAELLSATDGDFLAVAEKFVSDHSFRYYIVGSVSAGKSTTVSHFRSLLTQQEWAEERAPGMEKAPDLLSDEDRKRIDLWVANQIGIKNRKLTETSRSGLHVIDRAPLDAFAFTPPDESWVPKAKRLRQAISSGKANRSVQSGHVIFLRGDPRIMAERAISLHKNTAEKKLKIQQDELCIIYRNITPKEGFSEIDVRGRTIGEVVKLVADKIFRMPYVAADLDALLTRFETTGRPND